MLCCVKLFGVLINTDLKSICGWLWRVAGVLWMGEITFDNVLVDPGDEESSRFLGYLFVDGLVEGVQLCVRECGKFL